MSSTGIILKKLTDRGFARSTISAVLIFGPLELIAACAVDTSPIVPTVWPADSSHSELQVAGDAREASSSGLVYEGQAGSFDRAFFTDVDLSELDDDDGFSVSGSDSGSDSGTSGSDGSSSEPPNQPFDDDTEAGMSSNPPIVDGGNNGDKTDASDSVGNHDISERDNCDNRPVVSGCDPTKEGGCPDLMQCIIDPMAITAAGVCIFSTPMGADFCFSSPITESCPPTLVCYFGVCRELCLCDADCSTGRCCGEPVGAQGFKLCADC